MPVRGYDETNYLSLRDRCGHPGRWVPGGCLHLLGFVYRPTVTSPLVPQDVCTNSTSPRLSSGGPSVSSGETESLSGEGVFLCKRQRPI